MRPLASVVVPTRDRPRALAACLASLEAQRGVPAFEIVVVDDASADAATTRAVVAGSPRAQLVRGRGIGPAAARNLGAAGAEAPVVAFTDDDCRPAPDWLQSLLARFARGAEAVAGATVNGRPDLPTAVASQTITNHLQRSSLDSTTGTLGFAPTCNVAIRAEAHRFVPFDESYPLAAGEDREWCRRLADHGVALLFEPRAIVHHHQELSLGGFWRQQLRYGRGGLRWHRESQFGELQSPGFYLGLVRRGLAPGPSVGALVILAQGAAAVGMGWEAVSTIRSRSRRRPG